VGQRTDSDPGRRQHSIVALFEQELGVKSILMGFGLDIDALHSPNESYGLFNFYKGIETIPYFYKHYAELKKAPVEA
jgi:acetylornithine deacetylase/succinyl-diaminopimelate desuccinylase-like protein